MDPPAVDPLDGLATTDDALLGGRVRLRQPAKGYRAAIDPLLLAASLAIRPGETLLDLCCGVGTVGACALARVPVPADDGEGLDQPERAHIECSVDAR